MSACQRCGDTGSLSKTLEGDLDCVHCDVAGERVNFEAWTTHAHLLGGGVIDAWQLYQMGKAAAFEKAAKVCDSLSSGTAQFPDFDGGWEVGVEECAEKIRDLK